MADERDMELLDDYLSNRMDGINRSAFEQKIQADPDLRSEVTLQKAVVQRIRDARVAELKSMLNNVAVPAAGPGNALTSKVLLGAVTVILAAATYWFVARHETKTTPSAPAAEQNASKEQPVTPTPIESEVKPKVDDPARVQGQTIETDKNQTSAGTEDNKPSLATKPAPLSPPAGKKEGNESANDPAPEGDAAINDNAILRPVGSSLVIETHRATSHYSFHYQLQNGKLLLYGPFTKNAYEVMEWVTSDKSIVFLYYKKNYYPLNNGDDQVKQLTPLSDATLLQRLNESRSAQ